MTSGCISIMVIASSCGDTVVINYACGKCEHTVLQHCKKNLEILLSVYGRKLQICVIALVHYYNIVLI